MIILNSCHREDFPSHQIPTESDCPIEFSPISASLETKTDASATIEDFKVWASNKVNNVDNYNVFGSEGTDVRKSGSDWVYSPVRYWQSSDYSFYAVSPIEISTSIPISGTLANTGLSIHFGEKVDGSYTGWDLSSNQVDLLLASEQNVTTRLNATNTPVDLAFDHLLSKITFTAKNAATEDVDIIVTGIKIYGNQKVVTGFSSTWILGAKSTGEDPFINHTLSQPVTLSKTEPKLISPDVLVFPLMESATYVEVTLKHTVNSTTGYTKSAMIPMTSSWKSGKQYNYVINVTPDHIGFGTVSITSWDDNEGDGYSADDEIEF